MAEDIEPAEAADDITFPPASSDWGTVTAWVIPGVAYWVDERYWKVEEIEDLSDKLIYGPGEGPPWPRLSDNWDNDWDRLIVGRKAGDEYSLAIGRGSAICYERIEVYSQKDLAAMLKRLRRVVEALGWEWPGGL